MRILERVLAQDATPEDKLGHAVNQLKDLDDWARKSQAWMEKAEGWIATAATVFDRIDVRVAELDEREVELAKRAKTPEEKKVDNPPGLQDDETATKLNHLEALEAKAKERLDQLELAAATTRNDLNGLVERLDSYTRATEEAMTKQIGRVDAGMDRLEKGLRELDKVDGDVKTTIDHYYNTNGAQLKEMEAKLRQHDVYIQALNRKASTSTTSGGRWKSTSGRSGEDDGGDKKDADEKDEQRIPASFPEWIFEGDCHCFHVTDLI